MKIEGMPSCFSYQTFSYSDSLLWLAGNCHYNNVRGNIVIGIRTYNHCWTLFSVSLVAKRKRNENNIASFIGCHRQHPLYCPKSFQTRRLTIFERLLQEGFSLFSFLKTG